MTSDTKSGEPFARVMPRPIGVIGFVVALDCGVAFTKVDSAGAERDASRINAAVRAERAKALREAAECFIGLDPIEGPMVFKWLNERSVRIEKGEL